jgi:hypothetical protein
MPAPDESPGGAAGLDGGVLPARGDCLVTDGREHSIFRCANAGSRATIEKNGGVHEDTRNGKRRYWIETAP